MEGVAILSACVKSTLGAGGKTVAYMDAMGKPCITKDGVTVAKSVVLADQVQNMGNLMVQEAAERTVKDAGDGTTTAIVLTESIITLVEEALANKELTVREAKEGLDSGLNKIIGYLEQISKDVTDDMLNHVAAISCNNDIKLGSLIAKAFNQAGLNGEVLMQDSEDESTYVTTEKGVQLDCGIKSPYWRTDIDREVAELESPMVLLITSPLGNVRKIQNILEHAIKKNRSLLIIGEVEQQPLATLLSNKVKGVLKVNVIDVPGFGPTKQDTIDDVAFMTGAIAVSEELGDDFDFVDLSVLGEADTAITSQDKTILQVSDKDGVEERIAAVKDKMSKESNPYIKKKLEERIAILAGSVSVIKVGAESKIELKEKKDRIEDAIYAVKAAIKEGIVPGGGVALIDASTKLKKGKHTLGEELLYNAVLAPFTTILGNADMAPADPILERVFNRKGLGIDVVSGDVVDMVKRGIIDPVLVTKAALKNAVSVATTIISTDAIIANQLM